MFAPKWRQPKWLRGLWAIKFSITNWSTLCIFSWHVHNLRPQLWSASNVKQLGLPLYITVVRTQCIFDLTASIAIVPHLTAHAKMIPVHAQITAQTSTPHAPSVIASCFLGAGTWDLGAGSSVLGAGSWEHFPSTYPYWFLIQFLIKIEN